MKNVYMAMSIAGSDSCGGAGIQADIKTMSALGVFATTAITAVTCQNTMGVQAILPLSNDILKGQIESILADLPIRAIKIGMLHDESTARCVAETLQNSNYRGQIIVDPVMIATSGSRLSSNNLKDAIIEYLFPIATLLTPNLHEAEVLSGMNEIKNEDDMCKAAEHIIKSGASAVLIKGGHLEGQKLKNILLQKENEELLFSEFVSEKVDSKNTHGTGCSLSSAIASFCAIGLPLKQSVEKATAFVHDAVLEAKDVFLGHGNGSLNHFFNPQKLIIDESIHK